MKTAEKAPVNTFINSTISDAMVQFMNVNILQPEQLSPVLSPALANYKVCLYDPENFKESEILMMHGLKPHSKTLLFYLTHENYVSAPTLYSCCNAEGMRFRYKIWSITSEDLTFAQMYIVSCHEQYDLGMLNNTGQMYLRMLGNLTMC